MHKLNIGAGKKRLLGWTSVDANANSGADIVGHASEIPLPDACASHVMAIHLVEHLYPWEVPDALSEWFRLLAHGGSLVLELPDFMKSCKNIAEGYANKKHPDQLGMWGCWGDDRTRDPLMIHRSGWWFDRLAPLVRAAGFIDVTEHETVYHPCGRERRDFRLEARKP